MKPKTLHLKRPFGRTILLALFFLALMFLALELLLRAAPAQPYLIGLNPSLGGRHLQMEEQLARLDRYANEVGQVDCIFLGSSLVWMGFNPATFEDAFFTETGQKIRCFNLGIVTLPVVAASDLAELVIDKYQPWLLMYGTSARAYAIGPNAEDNTVILDTPWLQHQLGRRTLWTWLMSNSYALRYMRELSGLIRFDETAWTHLRNDEDITRGFFPRTEVVNEEHLKAAAMDAAQWLQPYEVLQVNLDSLATIANQDRDASQIIVVEMPVREDYFNNFTNGEADYARFVNLVSETLTAEQALFIRAVPGLIPEVGWWDRSHMNESGANLYSEWLAGRIADLLAAGELEPLPQE
ncbi:MAG: hypothetical protein R6X34_06745 [Chloroflexota bacterium]